MGKLWNTCTDPLSVLAWMCYGACTPPPPVSLARPKAVCAARIRQPGLVLLRRAHPLPCPTRVGAVLRCSTPCIRTRTPDQTAQPASTSASPPPPNPRYCSHARHARVPGGAAGQRHGGGVRRRGSGSHLPAGVRAAAHPRRQVRVRAAGGGSSAAGSPPKGAPSFRSAHHHPPMFHSHTLFDAAPDSADLEIPRPTDTACLCPQSSRLRASSLPPRTTRALNLPCAHVRCPATPLLCTSLHYTSAALRLRCFAPPLLCIDARLLLPRLHPLPH